MKYPHLIQAKIKTLALLLSLLFISQPTYPYAGQGGSVHGAVFTRGIIQDENGDSTYVAYDESGDEKEVIKKVSQEDLKSHFVMAVLQAQAVTEQYNTIKSEYNDVEVLTREAYNSLSSPANKPSVPSYINYLVVRGAAQREIMLDGNQLILQQSFIDPERTYSGKSMLVQLDGTVIKQSQNNIGLRASFLKDKENRPNYDERFYSFGKWRRDGYELVNPLSPVQVISPGYGADITDAEGKYSIPYRMFCPGMGFPVTIPIEVQLNYSRFNPRGRDIGTFYYQTRRYDYCSGAHMGLAGSGTLSGLMAYVNILGTLASMATPIVYNDVPIDVFFLTGSANLYGTSLSGQTRYNNSQSNLVRKVDAAKDFDQDGIVDRVATGKIIDTTNAIGEPIKKFEEMPIESAEVQGIWLSRHHDLDALVVTETLPSYTRLLDWSDDYQHRALLSEISENDLKNTDIYVFRVSDGTLITERRGIKEEEYNRRDYFNANGQKIRYSIQMINSFATRNSADYRLFQIGKFENWQAKGNMNPVFYERQSDHLRPGEAIKIVAINRATGYIGSVSSRLIKSTNSTSLSFNMPNITMLPPNLKIWATRKSTVENSGINGIQTIGNEGAGLSDDKTIIISTEWVEQDGTPLPTGLEDYGYTGRLAKVSEPNSLSAKQGFDKNGNQLAQFSIKPGRQTQLVRLSETQLGTEHMYVHVSGEPQKRRPDLSSGLTENFSGNFNHGDGTGILKYRPSKFVPVRVQIHDETTTKLALDVWRAEKKSNPDIEKPEPSYRWLYRPEFQVSVYDLEVEKILRTPDEGEEVDIYVSDDPAVSASDDVLKLLYDLTESAFDALDAYSYNDDRELIFSLAGNEVKATIGDDQTITFDNLDYLAALQPDDLLLITLFSNNDSANVLWEYDFTPLKLDIAVDLNRDGKIEFEDQYSWAEIEAYLSSGEIGDDAKKPVDRTYTTEEKDEPHIIPYRFWINNDLDVVNHKNDTKLDSTSCDGFNPSRPADDEYKQVCEQWDEPPKDNKNNTATSMLSKIESYRDLEDFAPLKIKIDTRSLADEYELEIKAAGISLNLFTGVWEDDNNKKAHAYIYDEATTVNQIQEANSKGNIFLKNGESHKFSKAQIEQYFDEEGIGYFIFEGVDKISDCQSDPKVCFLLVSYKKDDDIAIEKKVYIDLHDIEDFYHHITAGTAQGWTDDILFFEDFEADYKGTITEKHKIKVDIFQDLIPDKIINADFTMLVHGWRMKDSEKVNFAETSFKRLYWSGYQGRFGTFSWPTGWFNKPAYQYGGSVIDNAILNGFNYDRSEAVARRIGPDLANYIAGDFQVKGGDSPVTFNSISRKHLLVHSMGNIVVSEALRHYAGSGILFDTYIPSQAAEAAGAYDKGHEDISHSFLLANACDNPISGDNIFTPEEAWRCYNNDSFLDSEYDMPPDLHRQTLQLVDNNGVMRLQHGKTSDDATEVNRLKQSNINYYKDLRQSVGNIINMFNPKDAALKAWEFNHLTKPDGGGINGISDTWYYDNEAVRSIIPIEPETVHSRFHVGKHPSLTRELIWSQTLTKDSAEILASIIPARTKALGQSSLVSTMDNNIPLPGFIDSNQDHSGQFHGYYSEKRDGNVFRKNYWNQLLEVGLILDESNELSGLSNK